MPDETEELGSTLSYPKPEYLRVSAISDRVHQQGRRPSAVFLHLLDRKVQRFIDAACHVHNGGKKTLDATVAGHVGITK